MAGDFPISARQVLENLKNRTEEVRSKEDCVLKEYSFFILTMLIAGRASV